MSRITTRDGRRLIGEQTHATPIARANRSQTLLAGTTTIATSAGRPALALATDTTVVVGVGTRVSGSTGGGIVVVAAVVTGVATMTAPESEGNHLATVCTAITHTSRKRLSLRMC